MGTDTPTTATLSELLEQGSLHIKLDESIRDREEAYRNDLRAWGHTVRVCPGDVQFTLEGSDTSLDLYPNKPLRALRVENHFLVKAMTDPPHAYNVRMGGAFYNVYMNSKARRFRGTDVLTLTITRT